MRTAATFGLAAARYWLGVFPRTRTRLRRLRRRASEIEDPGLRELALEALAKRGNIEGAAAFAAFVGRRQRRRATDALVLYQAIYNHADTLAEQPSPDRPRNARQLHTALLDALKGVGEPLADYHMHDARHDDDGGYLAELVRGCRSALAGLPRFQELAPTAERAAERIVCFQGLDSDGPGSPLERWASSQVSAGSGLSWWEAAGAAGSSLVVHMAIATAASPTPSSSEKEDVAAIEVAYFPWICALHSLLDSLVDEREDVRDGQLSLIDCYEDRDLALGRLRQLAARAAQAAASLPRSRRHSVLLSAMVAHYLCELEPGADSLGSLYPELREQLGWPLGVALRVFRARQAAAGERRPRESAASRPPTSPVAVVHGRAPRERIAAVELEDA